MTPFATSDSWAADNRQHADGPPDEAPRVDLLLFASARVAAGRSQERVRGYRLSDVLTAACGRHGAHFAAVLESAQVWVNGEPATPDHLLAEGDEVAVLPPVSGGAGCR